MRTLCLLLVGVVVGWAAGSVDWTRDADAQGVFQATTGGEVADPQTGARVVAVPAVDSAPAPVPNSDARETPIGGEQQSYGLAPRQVYERRVGTDANGNQQITLQSRFVDEKGAILPEPGTMLVGRFQASAYGSPSGHGCYIVDTMTGQTWHVANGQPPQVVAQPMNPQAAQQPPQFYDPSPAPSLQPEPAQMPRTPPPAYPSAEAPTSQAPKVDAAD